MNNDVALRDDTITDDSFDDDVDYIPNSWVDDNGIRHAVVWSDTLPDRMRLQKINGKWELIDEPPF